MTMRTGRLLALLTLALAPAAHAADSRPITLAVDARQATRKTFHSHEVIPASPGSLTLYYPKWIPGEHGPTGPLTGVAGLRIAAGGKTLAWRRDLVDMYAIQCEVPPGAGEVTVDFDMVTAQENAGFTSGASSSAQLAVLNWNEHVLYPAGSTAADLHVAASLRIPEGWHAATALPIAHEGAGAIEFRPVSLFTLVDSPVQVGAYTRAIPLNPGEPRPVFLHIAADSRAALEISAADIGHY